ncbi:hypothetical protein RCL1_007366 [Eukaryota sp. TZLM3-RCL]
MMKDRLLSTMIRLAKFLKNDQNLCDFFMNSCPSDFSTSPHIEQVDSPPPTDESPLHDSSWSIYIYKVLKKQSPELGISNQAMTILNSMVTDLCNAIVKETLHIATINDAEEVTEKEAQVAVHLLLPPELGRFAAAEGREAVMRVDQYESLFELHSGEHFDQ